MVSLLPNSTGLRLSDVQSGEVFPISTTAELGANSSQVAGGKMKAILQFCARVAQVPDLCSHLHGLPFDSSNFCKSDNSLWSSCQFNPFGGGL